MKPAFLASFTTAADQSAKMGYGKTKRMLVAFEKWQVAQFVYTPVSTQTIVLTMIAEANVASSLLFALEEQLEEVVKALAKLVVEAQT